MVCAARGVMGSRIRENICRSGIMFQLRLNPGDRRVAVTPPILWYKEKVVSLFGIAFCSKLHEKDKKKQPVSRHVSR
jgi:hypothetical protein